MNAMFTAGRTSTQPLVDRHGRIANDLRVSLTDRCTLRCRYCMPAEGMAWLPTTALLTDAEVTRLIELAVCRLGVTAVRFTGGEPMVRRSLEEIVHVTSTLATADGTPVDISLTTNALGLRHRAAGLRAAGLRRVNVSLDSLNREHFAAIARRDRLPDVLAGLTAAREAGLDPIKINAVPQRDWYRQDAPELLRFALRNGFQLRFIEEMPIGAPRTWDRQAIVSAEDLLRALQESGFDLSPADGPRGTAPAELWNVAANGDAPAGQVGIIASVTRPFCDACTRTRLTADGRVRSCLFSQHEADLLAPMRSGASDDELAAIWLDAMWRKPIAHGIDEPGFARPSRTMSEIGG